MRTRAKDGSVLPVDKLNLSAAHHAAVSPVPNSYRDALLDANWHAAMQD